jgi:undecaprenyl diphosphate synthase
MEMTKGNDRMDLILALNYSGRVEITEAVKALARDVALKKVKPEEINQEILSNYLFTQDIPDPELLIRTSGENRISTFLLWQSAYTEFYFTEKLWPDFDKESLYEAIIDFQNRERRFGKTSEQLLQNSDEDRR